MSKIRVEQDLQGLGLDTSWEPPVPERPWIYMLSALTPTGSLSSKEAERRKAFYVALQESRPESFADTDLYLPQQHSDPVRMAHLTPIQVLQRNHWRVVNARAVVADLPFPSHGAGTELEMLRLAGLPVVAFAPDGALIHRTASLRVSRQAVGAVTQGPHVLIEYLRLFPNSFTVAPECMPDLIEAIWAGLERLLLD